VWALRIALIAMERAKYEHTSIITESGYMAILNYTTKIAVNKTVAEIHAILLKAKADAIQNEYANGSIKAIAFRLNTPQGIIYYKLPANVNGVKCAMVRDKVKHPDMNAQSARVAWRIVKDWIEAQMAIIQANMAEVSQVFLPYAVTSDGRTVFERFKAGGVGTIGITYQKGEE